MKMPRKSKPSTVCILLSKEADILIAGICDYTWHGKSDFADTIKLFWDGSLSRLSEWAQCNHQIP